MKNGKDSTHKKRAFPKRLKKSRHKKEPTGFLWNPQSEFTSDEENSAFQGIYADGTNCLYFCLFVKGPHEMSL